MKVSTRGRYGLRAMLELAEHFGGSPVMMSTLAERQRLSRKYLHRLLTSLKAAGLVCSVRGPGGVSILNIDSSVKTPNRQKKRVLPGSVYDLV